MSNEDLYCKLYIDTEVPREELVEAIQVTTTGTRNLRTISSSRVEVDVLLNEEFDDTKRDTYDGFLFYRYIVDVVPVPGVSRPEFVSATRLLIQALRTRDYRIVPACDFEDELSQ